MTVKTIDIAQSEINTPFNKLSIQVGLNGLSFCVLDTISNNIEAFERITFKTHSTPYLMLKELKSVLDKEKLMGTQFSEIVVVHRSNLFGLVPKTLFSENELPDYLKFNAKIMANDEIVYDELDNHDMVNVYIPFTNVNNYIFDLFGEFEFKHCGSVLISTLLNQSSANQNSICYVQVSENEMEIVVISEKKLLFYNFHQYKTKEDFIYFLLFSLEQLQMDLEKIQLKLFGIVEEGDPIYKLCYTYIKHVSVFVPSNATHLLEQMENQSIDFTVISSL